MMKKYKLSDLYEMSSGISSKPEQAGHGDPFVSFSTVFKDFFLPDELVEKMDTSSNEQERYSVKKGDVFLTRTSETLDELGMSSVAIKDYPNATFSGFLKRLRPKSDKFPDEKFMAFYLRGKTFRKAMNNNAIMTLRASLNEQIFSYLDVILPNLDSQIKIGNFLHLIQKKIYLNNKINAELEAMAKTIYDYWFVQFDFPDKNGKPYKSSGGKMVWNEELKREIPEGWGVKELKDVANITMGQSPPGSSYNCENEGIPFFQGCTDFTFRFPVRRIFTTKPSRFANMGSILLSVRAPVGRINLAKERCCIGRGLASLEPINEEVVYLYQVMKGFENIFERRNETGTTFGAITKDDLFKLKVVYPDKAVLKKFENSLRSSYKKQNISQEENRFLIKLRDFLLPMLMNGQVRVR